MKNKVNMKEELKKPNTFHSQLKRTHGSELRGKSSPQNMSIGTKVNPEVNKQLLIFWHLFHHLKALSFCFYSEH